MTYAQELTDALSKLGRARVRIAAAALGVTPPTVRSWAAGRTEPSAAEKAGALAILAEITAPIPHEKHTAKNTRSRR